jgi:Flp pilus assembly protein TadB
VIAEASLESDSRNQRGETSAEETETDDGVAAFAGEERRDGSASDARGMLRQPWLILSFVLIAAAAVFLLLSHTDAAFVAIALGVCAWFWNLRVRLKRQYGIKSGRRAQTRSGDGD